EIDPRVASNFGHKADEKHRDVDAALDQRSRDDESVAAVVAASAQHGHAALEEFAVDGLDGRHDLTARVLHQDERRDAYLFNRAAIGLAHLRGVQDTHDKTLHRVPRLCSGRPEQRRRPEDAEDTEASYYSTQRGPSSPPCQAGFTRPISGTLLTMSAMVNV